MADFSAVPRHLRSPGEEGYRTPTIEDAEQGIPINRTEYSISLSGGEAHSSALEALNGSISRTVTSYSAKGAITDNVPGIDHTDPTRVPSEQPDKLSWRQRIRHFTWAFFTLTMATGGIANALHTGKRSPSCAVKE